MDDYEAEVARQPGGPFSKVAERKLIRRVAEHWWDRQRYSAERKRRIKAWIGWVVVGSPLVGVGLTILKFFIAGSK